jgi:hypothetical protein
VTKEPCTYPGIVICLSVAFKVQANVGTEEIRRSSPMSSRKWKVVKKSGSGAYIACLSKGQKWGFKYMKAATDSGGTGADQKGGSIEEGYRSKINNEHILLRLQRRLRTINFSSSYGHTIPSLVRTFEYFLAASSRRSSFSHASCLDLVLPFFSHLVRLGLEFICIFLYITTPHVRFENLMAVDSVQTEVSPTSCCTFSCTLTLRSLDLRSIRNTSKANAWPLLTVRCTRREH